MRIRKIAIILYIFVLLGLFISMFFQVKNHGIAFDFNIIFGLIFGVIFLFL